MTSLQPRRPPKARQVFENEANFVQIKNDPNCFIAKFLRKNVIFTQKGFIIYSVNFHQVCQHFSVNISWKHCKVGTGILGRQTNTSKKKYGRQLCEMFFFSNRTRLVRNFAAAAIKVSNSQNK